ncbi:MAG: cobalamin-dependent protein [Candidatus Bathyarchaeota archaeon]|nr:cobalamin-dependent protein [Candidatus Bathyarchaeota archaeon]
MSWLKSMMEKEPPEPENPIGIIVIGNLDPDVHEASSEQVRKALKRAQFKVVKLGKKVPAEVFASKAKEVNADIIAVSVNTTPAKDNLPKLLPAIESTGLKNRVGLMIGGAAVKSEDAEKIGAIYGKTKEEAVAIAKKILEEKKAK